MSVLIISAGSYVGFSLFQEISNSGIAVVGISQTRQGKGFFKLEEIQPCLLSEIDTIIHVNPRGLHGASFQRSSFNKPYSGLTNCRHIVLSTTQIDSQVNLVPKTKMFDYINSNIEFEKSFKDVSSAKILRIPNFVGVLPNDFENQKKLTPWSLIDDYIATGNINLRNDPNTKIRFCNSKVLFSSIKELSSLFTDENIFYVAGTLEIDLSEMKSLIQLIFEDSDTSNFQRSFVDQQSNILESRHTNAIGNLNFTIEGFIEMIRRYIQEATNNGKLCR